MRILTSAVVLLLALLCGCATCCKFKDANGDLGQFILRQAAVRGREANPNGGLPAIPGSWSYREDKYGIIIRFQPADFDAIESFLYQAFGEPTIRPEASSANSSRLGVYRITTTSGPIQFSQDDQGARVIILNPKSFAK